MEKQKRNFINSYDAALLAYAVLRKLGSGKMGTFDQRLRSQKVQYLAQLFGVSPKYGFSLYLWGPYSPGLANDLFQLEGSAPGRFSFVAEELEERFNELKKFISGKSNRDLECITTAHWLLRTAGLQREATERKLMKLKSTTPKGAKRYVDVAMELPGA